MPDWVTIIIGFVCFEFGAWWERRGKKLRYSRRCPWTNCTFTVSSTNESVVDKTLAVHRKWHERNLSGR